MKKITLPIIEVGKVLHHKKINDQVIKNKKILDKFFKIELSLPQIILFNSRKDMDEYWGWKTQSWMVGWSKSRAIYLLHPDHYLKESNHTDPKRYWKILLHEHAHQYINFLTNGVAPRWLNEGLASYLANQIHKVPDKTVALRVLDKLDFNDKDVYKIGYFWIELLFKKFGKNKLLQLLKELKSSSKESQFKSIFYKIYKIKFSKKDFLSLYKNEIN
jgi:hypothetical protein